MDDIISVEVVEEGLYRLVDPMGYMAHLVLGDDRAALVDAMLGIGDVRAVAERLCAGRPLTVLLTHRHPDHTGGAYRFDEVLMPALEDGHWDEVEDFAPYHRTVGAESDPAILDAPWAISEGARPHVTHVADGDAIDLGGRSLVCASLPGHTEGSMGYLCPELGVLLSGDAVTPVMFLCFGESLPVSAWRETLDRMEALPFERFYTGHHRHAFVRADLASFRVAADFAERDRGRAWHHARIPTWEGTCHLCPCDTRSSDSPDFRAVITRGLPPRRRRARAAD